MSELPTPPEEASITVNFFDGYTSAPETLPIGSTVSDLLRARGLTTDNFIESHDQRGTGLLQLHHNDTPTFKGAFPHVVLVDGDRIRVFPAQIKGG